MFKYFLVPILVSLILPAFAQEGPPAMVRTVRAVQGEEAAMADMVGTLYFERVSRVSPEEGARITQVNFQEGDRIQRGDILVRMDSRILEAELALQKARLAQVGIRMKKTKLNLDRYTQLFKKNVATESEYDDLRLTYDEQAQERIALARQVEILEIRLKKHVVKAPFDGMVIEKQAEIGEWVQPGAVLCVLGAADALYAGVPVAEHLIGFIQAGDRIELTLNAFGRTLEGTVEGIGPVADPKTKNVTVKLRLDYHGPMAVNMSVTARMPVTENRTLILLPRDALVQQRGRDMVYTVAENKASAVPVTVQYSRGDRIGIAPGGILPGTAVVIEGNERLKPGQSVVVQGGDN